MKLHPVYAIENNFLRRAAIIITLPGQLCRAVRHVFWEAAVCWKTNPRDIKALEQHRGLPSN